MLHADLNQEELREDARLKDSLVQNILEVIDRMVQYADEGNISIGFV